MQDDVQQNIHFNKPVLINRHFSQELINYLLIVTVIVLVIFLGNQLIRYLNDAAAGNMALAVVGKLILLEIPYLLSLLLPVTFFIALLLLFGQLSANNEFIALKACGFSRWQTWQMIAKPCYVLVCIIALLGFWIHPKIALYRNQLLATTNTGASMDTLMPGKFQPGLGGRYVFYVDKSSLDRKHLNDIFIAERNLNIQNTWNVSKAASGHLVTDPNTQAQFIQISNGMRTRGNAGENHFQLIEFDQYLLRIQNPTPQLINQIDAYNNLQLIALRKQSHNHLLAQAAAAELEWRISLPLTCLLLAILGCLFGTVPPRQSRYTRLLPGILFLIFYINILLVVRGEIANGTLAQFPGMFIVHGLCAFCIMLYLMPWRRIWQRSSAA
jgi:lipopolysaccharide export system permease protein